MSTKFWIQLYSEPFWHIVDEIDGADESNHALATHPRWNLLDVNPVSDPDLRLLDDTRHHGLDLPLDVGDINLHMENIISQYNTKDDINF